MFESDSQFVHMEILVCVGTEPLPPTARILPSKKGHRLLARVRRGQALLRWSKRSWALPAPQFVKQAVLERLGIPGAPWLETGTYRGDTTAFLAGSSVLEPPLVISLEPSEPLHRAAVNRMSHLTTVKLICASSEAAFEPQLLTLESAAVNLWLDGHYSGGKTSLVGESSTPIEHELSVLRRNAERFHQIALFVDDTRQFGNSLIPEFGYPKLSLLTEWAETLGLNWHFEHDIFIARGTPHV